MQHSKPDRSNRRTYRYACYELHIHNGSLPTCTRMHSHLDTRMHLPSTLSTRNVKQSYLPPPPPHSHTHARKHMHTHPKPSTRYSCMCTHVSTTHYRYRTRTPRPFNALFSSRTTLRSRVPSAPTCIISLATRRRCPGRCRLLPPTQSWPPGENHGSVLESIMTAYGYDTDIQGAHATL